MAGVEVSVAEKRWCPMARAPSHYTAYDYNINGLQQGSHQATVTANRECGRTVDSTNCIADRCMAWRWIDERRGVCGLAGPLFKA